jgi:RNase P/RNase MRP subunit POP5
MSDMTTDEAGLTVKELVLRLEGTVNSYIVAHDARHARSELESATARADPMATGAGRHIETQLTNFIRELADLTGVVASHERTIQRILGALTLLSILGIGTLVLLLLRISGIVS